MHIDCDGAVHLREWRDADVPALVRHANNRRVWLNLKDRFPHPYTVGDARDWIERCVAVGEPPLDCAVVLDGEPIGGIGTEPQQDVFRRTAEVGYWLGETYWGQGFATAALRAFTSYLFAHFPFERLEAGVFEWNPASGRVLEKNGFELEGRLRKSVLKDGQLLDRFLYARLRSS